MKYNDQDNIFNIDLKLNLILCDNLYLVLVLTSMETANYLGMNMRHVWLRVVYQASRVYVTGFHKMFINTHDNCFNTWPNP